MASHYLLQELGLLATALLLIAMASAVPLGDHL
jgi:hypothetical protein